MKDKITQITTNKYCTYGLSENGNLYALSDDEKEWVLRAGSPQIKLKEVQTDPLKIKEV